VREADLWLWIVVYVLFTPDCHDFPIGVPSIDVVLSGTEI
jgi:hypothetical protein